MADAPNDQLSRYYAEKLWELIPPVHRDADAEDGVLRALVEVLAEQAAIVRRSNDRLWEDEFIDLCDSWAVPYLGDLVGTRMVSALNPRGRRVDVANTIYYRRRAGTLAVLEGLTADITGWEGTVVEGFRQVVRHPHGLDRAPAPTGRFTGTPVHGLPDLRRPRGAQIAWGPWDEYAHLPDMRRHHGGLDGRYGITKLAFHLFQLGSYAVLRGTPRTLAVDANGKKRFSFDPSGRTSPLFQENSRPDFNQGWRPAREWELPARLRCEVLGHAEYVVTEGDILVWVADGVVTAAAGGLLRTVRGVRFSSESALRIRLADLFAPALGLAAEHRILADALVADCGKFALLPAGDFQPGAGVWSVMVEQDLGPGLAPVPREVILAGNLSLGVVSPTDKQLVIDAENGLGYFTTGAPPPSVAISYSYGFSGPIGAGSYSRPGLEPVPAAGQHSGGGAIPAPAAALSTAVAVIDSATYGPVADMTAQGRLLVQSDNEQRPYLELAGDWTLTATQADSELVIDGLWFGGRAPRTIRLAAAANASWAMVSISHATLDPGGADADGVALGPVALSVESTVSKMVIDSCVLGPVDVAPTGLVERLTITNSIVHSIDAPTTPVALRAPNGVLNIRGCTVLGQLVTREIEASELLCTGRITVANLQAGCIRFSAFPNGSQVPRAYRTTTVSQPEALFTSLRFGDPGYAQLSDVAPPSIARGGENGTEIGAFTGLLTPIKLDSLQAKVDEFLPFGLIPLYISEA